MTEDYILRNNTLQKADTVWKAWTSGDLDQMLKVLNVPTNPKDRHFLLLSIISETYKLRKTDPATKELCEKIAWMHLKELPGIIQHLKSSTAELPRISTFQNLASLLTEKGEYQKAIEVCELAISYGLSDKTQGGFQGRIDRIKKKMKQ